jgi:integrase
MTMKDSKTPKPGQMPNGTTPADPATRKRGGRPRRTVFPEKPSTKTRCPWRKLRQEVGTGLALVEHLQKAHPNDPFAQLAGFFREFRIQAATGRKRAVGFKTRHKYVHIMMRVLETLRELNMRIRNLTELSAKQVRYVHRKWEADGASDSSLAMLNTVLRRFGVWIGKPQLAPPVRELLANPERGRRSTSLVHAKDWESCGIDREAAFEKMRAQCRFAAMQLRLGWAFGLRVEEQLMLRPAESDKGDKLWIHRGTKGGRWREVEIKEQWERDLVDEAKAMAATHPKGILAARPSRTLEQARNHYYYLCRKIGLQAKGCFASTPHGARHSFAVRHYELEGGVPAPVLGGPMLPRETDLKVRQRLAEQLGHGRATATAAYVGTVAHITTCERKSNTCLMEREQLLATDETLLSLVREAKVLAFFLVGPAATGDALAPEALILCDAVEPLSDQMRTAIPGRVGELLHTECVLVDRSRVESDGLATFEIRALGQFAAEPCRRP